LNGNPSVKRDVIQAFATGAGGYPKGSVSEDKYLEGVIGPTQEWLKQQEEARKKAATQNKTTTTSSTPKKDLFDKLASQGASMEEMSAAMAGVTKKSGATITGNGNTSSLRNSGGSGGGSGGSGSDSSSGSSSKEKSQFEKDYEYHQHLLAMEKEDYEAYIKWLDQAYKDAYANGQIELEDFYEYEEEVFQGRKELFQDSIEDIEHKIKGLERDPGNEAQIINYYNQIIQKIDNELAAARARGLNDDDDYVQELLEQKWDYADEIKDIQDEITENAKDAVEDLVDYRIDMLKQDLENERDAISDKLDTLRDFYDKQKEMLQDVYDEEKYLEEQSEKRKSVDDIKAEIDMLRFDDSAKAQKRIKELQEELKDAEKELSDFEKDHALENATDLLDKMYEQQESQMQSEMDALEEKLNDPKALYNQALRDIQNNTLALYEEMIKYNNKYGSGNAEDIYTMWDEADKSLDAYFKTMGESYKNILLADAYKPTGYASGTSHATSGIHELFEGNKDEYVYTTKDGKKYRMFSGLGDKVLNASATDFLYKFANNGEAFISNMLNGLVGAIGNVGKPAQQVQLSTGDIIIQGNATQETVSAIRRAQRENVDYILREFTRLNR
jgi:DNA repair exonuclease SbcCD ATPase subunit